MSYASNNLPSTTTGTGSTRGPGSFSPLLQPSSQQQSSHSQASRIRRVESSSSEDDSQPSSHSILKNPQNAPQLQQRSPALQGITTHSNLSTGSLTSLSRPAAISNVRFGDASVRTTSPLSLAPTTLGEPSRTHTRKHSNSQGYFEPSLSTTATISSTIGSGMAGLQGGLTASQIAAQAAMQHQSQHQRQRSQTLPLENPPSGQRKVSKGPTSPPLLSLTEASGERQTGFGSLGGQGALAQSYRNGLLGLGGSTNPAATAANAVFQRSPQHSPGLSPSESGPSYKELEKLSKPEKSSKVKLFSRPGKMNLGKETKDKPLPSPSKLGNYSLANLQRSNMSTQSLADSMMSGASSLYTLPNASNSTIRPIDAPIEREKEKKHHLFSRQKHKISGKDDHHLPLSSAASNSRPVDPNAPSSLYNFNLPPSPGPSSNFAKSMSGLDLRHGGRALREKKKEAAGSNTALRENDAMYQGSDWPGPSSIGSDAASFLGPSSSGIYASSLYGGEQDLSRYGLNNMGADDAWPFLRARLLIIFEGEDLRLPVEDFNRLVSVHLNRCIQKRAPSIIVEDLRDLLVTGFSSLDQTLRRTPDDRLIPHLVEMWLFTFTSVVPYMQAVFLPLDLEFSGDGVMPPEKAREFWGALQISSTTQTSSDPNNPSTHINVPASQVLEVRRIVLTAYRDTVILPRFDTLKTLFSRLSLESINSNVNTASENILSTSPDSYNRPGTAMSLDPSNSSYNSQSTTLLGGADSTGARSRAISNVSYGSDPPIPQIHRSGTMDSVMPSGFSRPYTPSATNPSLLGVGFGSMRDAAQREANADESKLVTETVGRMLQCMSVLASVGLVAGAGNTGDEEAQAKMEELCKALKLNWLGRGRTGRNRRGFVGTKIQRDQSQQQQQSRL